MNWIKYKKSANQNFFSWNQFHENFVKLVSRKKGYTIFFYFQVEFYWLLPFVYDDLSYPMWWMDRTIVGLYASRRKSGKFFIFSYFSVKSSSRNFSWNWFHGKIRKKPNLFSNADILSKLDFFFNSQSSIKSREKYVRTIAEHPKFQSVTWLKLFMEKEVHQMQFCVKKGPWFW